MKWDAAAKRRAGLPEVSQMGALPHLVGCLPQMVGLGGSRAEDVALILPCLQLGTQTRVPPQCRRPAGAAEKYQQRLFAGRCHSVLPGLQVYFATLPCLAAASQRLFISAPEKF